MPRSAVVVAGACLLLLLIPAALGAQEPPAPPLLRAIHISGASGARVLTTLVYALQARKLRYGVASLCIGGGMGIAMAVEAI